jgi:hypothetical protein
VTSSCGRRSTSHGENRGSSPLGSANDFNNLRFSKLSITSSYGNFTERTLANFRGTRVTFEKVANFEHDLSYLPRPPRQLAPPETGRIGRDTATLRREYASIKMAEMYGR